MKNNSKRYSVRLPILTCYRCMVTQVVKNFCLKRLVILFQAMKTVWTLFMCVLLAFVFFRFLLIWHYKCIDASWWFGLVNFVSYFVSNEGLSCPIKLSLLWRRFEEFMASANAVSNRVSTESTPYVLYI